MRTALCSLIFLVLAAGAAHGQATLNGHPVKLDAQGKLISWVQPQDQAYSRVIRLAWNFLLNKAQVEPNGLKTFYTYCCIDPKTMHGTGWPHNPAGLNAMLVDSVTAYYAFSGDQAPVELVSSMVDYQLAHGTTPKGWAWPQVPYASSNFGALEYRGADSTLYTDQQGVGDGYGYIEPDKVGELGLGYLKLYEMTGDEVYREAALACADALARHVREGDAEHSPWPFRVNAENNAIREEYSSNAIGPIKLFDELVRQKLGNLEAYRKARETAWAWLMKYPMENNSWSGYFEDVYTFTKPINFNQYSSLETARYILQHPEYDAHWKKHVPGLIEWVEKTLIFVDVTNEPAVQWGANAVSEQRVADMNKMGSHTSRYASLNAMWYEASGEETAKEKAYRSFNWASYMCGENGLVKVGPVDQSLWFSDGYGDYIRHFLAGMGAVPAWAPADESHLLRSTSIIQNVHYGSKSISYTTFDESGTEVLRLAFAPRQVRADGKLLPATAGPVEPGWSFDAKSGVLRIRRNMARTVQIAAD